MTVVGQLARPVRSVVTRWVRAHPRASAHLFDAARLFRPNSVLLAREGARSHFATGRHLYAARGFARWRLRAGGGMEAWFHEAYCASQLGDERECARQCLGALDQTARDGWALRWMAENSQQGQWLRAVIELHARALDRLLPPFTGGKDSESVGKAGSFEQRTLAIIDATLGLQIARALLARGRWHLARGLLERIGPDMPGPAAVFFAHLSALGGSTLDERRWLERAEGAASLSAEARALVTLALFAADYPERAGSTLERICAEPAGLLEEQLLFEELRAQQRSEQAWRLGEALLLASGAAKPAARRVAVVALEAGRPDRCLDALRSITDSRSAGRCGRLWAHALVNLGRGDEALKNAGSAPAASQRLSQVAEVLLRTGREAKGLELVQSASWAEPDLRFKTQLRLLALDGRDEEIQELCERHPASRRHPPTALHLANAHLRQLQDHEAAERLAVSLRTAHEDLPSSIWHLLRLFNLRGLGLGDWNSALEFVERALLFVPGHERLIAAKAQALAGLEREDEALALASRAVPRWRHGDYLAAEVAALHAKHGRRSDAVRCVNAILRRHSVEPLEPAVQETAESALALNQLSTAALSVSEAPSVTVIMTSHRWNEFIPIAIRSILEQTVRVELLIVDDASRDGSLERLQSVIRDEKSGSHAVHLFRLSRNSGTYVAKNHLLERATGEYVTFHDSDDWAHPRRIQRQIETLEATPGAMACVCRSLRILSDGQLRSWRPVGAAAGSFLMRRVPVVKRLGAFHAVPVSADSEYLERIRSVFGRRAVAELEAPLQFMASNDTSLTGAPPFQISWRGPATDRHLYMAAYRRWHRRLIQGDAAPYVPFPGERPCPVPSSMEIPLADLSITPVDPRSISAVEQSQR